MIELNVQFQEAYKRMDNFCKDICESDIGVTQYITDMEKNISIFRRNVPEWDYVYNQLKYLRRIRNKLVHEVGTLNSDICTEEDIKWIEDFCQKILTRNDPLAKVGHLDRQYSATQPKPKTFNSSDEQRKINNSKPSLWSRIKAKFKKWFNK